MTLLHQWLKAAQLSRRHPHVVHVDENKCACSHPDLCAAMEVGPQSHGVVRSNIYMAMKRGVQLMLKWVHDFNSGVTKCRFLSETLSFVWTLCSNCALSHQGGFLKEGVWTSTPWSNTSTTQETQRLTTSQLPSIHISRYLVLKQSDSLYTL